MPCLSRRRRCTSAAVVFIAVWCSVYSVITANDTNKTVSTMTAHVGENVLLPCTTTYDTSVDWRYMKSERSLPQFIFENFVVVDAFVDKVKVHVNRTARDYSMTLLDVQTDSSGWYVCVENRGDGAKHVIVLNVTDAVLFTSIEGSRYSSPPPLATGVPVLMTTTTTEGSVVQGNSWIAVAVVIPIIVLILIALVVIYCCYKRYKYNRKPTKPFFVKLQNTRSSESETLQRRLISVDSDRKNADKCDDNQKADRPRQKSVTENAAKLPDIAVTEHADATRLDQQAVHSAEQSRRKAANSFSIPEFIWRYCEKYMRIEIDKLCDKRTKYTYIYADQLLKVESIGDESMDDILRNVDEFCKDLRRRIVDEQLTLTNVTLRDDNNFRQTAQFLAGQRECVFYVDQSTPVCHIVGPKNEAISSLRKDIDQLATGDLYVFVTSGDVFVRIAIGNLVESHSEVIVSSSNRDLLALAGGAKAILDAAGDDVRQECDRYLKKYGPLAVGDVMHTASGNLGPRVQYIIHAAAPSPWDKDDLYPLIYRTFYNCFSYANETLKAGSISVPAICAGNYGVDKKLVADAAFDAVMDFVDPEDELGGKGQHRLKRISFENKDKETTATFVTVFKSYRQSRQRKSDTYNHLNCKIVLGSGLTVRACRGVIVKEKADAIVCPTNRQLEFRSDDAKTIAAKAGESMSTEAKDYLKFVKTLTATQVMHTTAGALRPSVCFVIIVVEPDDVSGTNEKRTALARAYLNCLLYVNNLLNVSTLSFPPIGAASDRTSNLAAEAACMALTQFDQLMLQNGRKRRLKCVNFVNNENRSNEIFVRKFDDSFKSGAKTADKVELTCSLSSFFAKSSVSTYCEILQLKGGVTTFLSPAGITVDVSKGNLVHEKADVIVCSVNSRLENVDGAAVKKVADAAGNEMKQALQTHAGLFEALADAEVLHTTAGQLRPTVHWILLVVEPPPERYLGRWRDYYEKLVESFYNCLLYANCALRASSISLPAISADNAGSSARAAFDAVLLFDEHCRQISTDSERHIKNIRFVTIEDTASVAFKRRFLGPFLMYTTKTGIDVHVHQGDLVEENSDVIVCSVNSRCEVGAGAARAIAEAAGDQLRLQLEKYISENGKLEETKAMHTTAGDMESVSFVVFAAAPPPGRHANQDELLSALSVTFFNCLQYANDTLRASTISVPGIGAGVYSLPKTLVATAAYRGLTRFDEQYKDRSTRFIKTVKFVNILVDTAEAFVRTFDEQRRRSGGSVRDDNTNLEASLIPSSSSSSSSAERTSLETTSPKEMPKVDKN